MKVYVDLDGVILNTEDHIFNDYDEQKEKGLVKNHLEYAININWEEVLMKAEELNLAIYYINNSDIETSVLTKVHSLDEGSEKVKDLRKRGLTKEIIIAPYKVKKAEVVNPTGNLLIDDNLNNLDEWVSKGGMGLFFNARGNNIDNYGKENNKYTSIKELSILLNEEKLNKLIAKQKGLILTK